MINITTLDQSSMSGEEYGVSKGKNHCIRLTILQNDADNNAASESSIKIRKENRSTTNVDCGYHIYTNPSRSLRKPKEGRKDYRVELGVGWITMNFHNAIWIVIREINLMI